MLKRKVETVTITKITEGNRTTVTKSAYVTTVYEKESTPGRLAPEGEPVYTGKNDEDFLIDCSLVKSTDNLLEAGPAKILIIDPRYSDMLPFCFKSDVSGDGFWMPLKPAHVVMESATRVEIKTEEPMHIDPKLKLIPRETNSLTVEFPGVPEAARFRKLAAYHGAVVTELPSDPPTPKGKGAAPKRKRRGGATKRGGQKKRRT